MTSKITVVLSRDRDGLAQRRRLEREILVGLEGRHDLNITVVGHLYDLPSDGTSMELLRSSSAGLILLCWLYPRSAYWVLAAHGIKGQLGPTTSLPEEEDEASDPSCQTIWCLDLRQQSCADKVIEEVNRIASALHAEMPVEPGDANGHPLVVDEPTTHRWYPVVDYSRCGNCGECLNFCLFGVYGLDELNRIIVEQPDACRPGCPACSRICPQGAIMFPQHDDPAIAGDPTASRDGLKLDLSQLFSAANLQELARAERRRALAEQQKSEAPDQQPADGLEDLVDRVDEMDL